MARWTEAAEAGCHRRPFAPSADVSARAVPNQLHRALDRDEAHLSHACAVVDDRVGNLAEQRELGTCTTSFASLTRISDCCTKRRDTYALSMRRRTWRRSCRSRCSTAGEVISSLRLTTRMRSSATMNSSTSSATIRALLTRLVMH